MRWLERKIPPPLVGLLIGSGMWLFAKAAPLPLLDDPTRWVVAALFVASGLMIALLGAAALRRAQTTVNPLKPETTSTLVVIGIYQHTRNPMYVGFAMALVGWAAYLSAPMALVGPVLFVLFIARFQILPEEQALGVKFGAEFFQYKTKVRRWL